MCVEVQSKSVSRTFFFLKKSFHSLDYDCLIFFNAMNTDHVIIHIWYYIFQIYYKTAQIQKKEVLKVANSIRVLIFGEKIYSSEILCTLKQMQSIPNSVWMYFLYNLWITSLTCLIGNCVLFSSQTSQLKVVFECNK